MLAVFVVIACGVPQNEIEWFVIRNTNLRRGYARQNCNLCSLLAAHTSNVISPVRVGILSLPASQFKGFFLMLLSGIHHKHPG